MKVHILGGGIGGMSAALHLTRAGVPGTDIVIHEKDQRLGGKAVSQIAEIDGLDGTWPGEHGFRFFPNFYRCIVDTLRHVPITPEHAARRGLKPEAVGTVAKLLIETVQGAVAMDGRVHAIKRAESLREMPGVVAAMFAAFPVPARDVAVFSAELVRFLVTCHERALDTWETDTLQEFMKRNGFSDDMRTFLRSLRALSAMRADRGSLRTLLFTATQMLADFDDQHELWDAILPGPTDYVMLEPWADALRELGVQTRFGEAVVGLEFAAPKLGLPSRLARVRMRTDDGAERVIDAGPNDYFVLAIPFERARPLVADALHRPTTLDPILGVEQDQHENLGLGAEPMVGIQYFLKTDRPITGGHAVYPKAKWAMTSISQAQFWRKTFSKPLEDVFGAPGLKGVLSVIVSAWEAPADRIPKAPVACTEEELAKEAFQQIMDGVGGELSWDDVIACKVDRDIQFTPGRAHCPTPLWVSPAGSYTKRPKADPGCGNFFIASDWAMTDTDVGSMESADEAARLAVQGIIEEAQLDVPADRYPTVRPLRLWQAVEAVRAVDRWMYHHGLPHPLDLPRPFRTVVLAALRAARLGASADWFEDQREVILKSLGLPVVAAAPVDVTGAGKSELDRAVRVLEAIDASGWNHASTDADAPLDALVSELAAVD